MHLERLGLARLISRSILESAPTTTGELTSFPSFHLIHLVDVTDHTCTRVNIRGAGIA